jgi:hypothetical protein
MKPAGSVSHELIRGFVREEIGAWSRAVAVLVASSTGAAIGALIGYGVGTILLESSLIQPGSSTHMPMAVVGALGGGIGWLIGAVAAMVACRHRPPPSRRESIGLLVTVVGIACAAALLADLMVWLQDPFEDPRMFRLHRLIWLDASIASLTCLLLAIRTKKIHAVVIAILVVAWAGAAVFAVSQVMPFLAGCAPVQSGACRVGY